MQDKHSVSLLLDLGLTTYGIRKYAIGAWEHTHTLHILRRNNVNREHLGQAGTYPRSVLIVQIQRSQTLRTENRLPAHISE